MNFTDDFARLLARKVNIDSTRLATLDTNVGAITDALSADGIVGPWYVAYRRQGSWAHRTIIKPPNGEEFDADILLELALVPGWDAIRYLDEVEAALERTRRYAGKVRGKTRSVRVQYAGEHHVDVVPFVRTAAGRGQIFNRERNEPEASNPLGFSDWFAARNTATNANLKRVVRILKYVRRDRFDDVRSVILTTLLGEQVDIAAGEADPDYYGTVPTTLWRLATSLAEFLDANSDKPKVRDPSAPGLTFDHRWDPSIYSDFRDQFGEIAQTIDEAYQSGDRAESVGKWREVLGDDFAPSVSPSVSTGPFGPPVATPARPGRSG